MIRFSPRLLLAGALLLAGCGDTNDEGPVEVSVIGESAEVRDPNRSALGPADRLLIDATAQGLVAFDGAGQIERALAQRWIVTDNGRSYIFRLRDALWPDGERVTADQVARRLRSIVARRSDNRLKPMLDAIDEIVVITPEVLEIRLLLPRPPLLELLAQPEMAIVSDGNGAGPFRFTGEERDEGVLLEPVIPEGLDEETEAMLRAPERTVLLRAESAGIAVARFDAGEADLVLGGTYVDLAVAQAAQLPGGALRIDPAEGLFGLLFVEDEGALAEPAIRRALAMAIDRARLVEAFQAQGWQPMTSILPQGFGSAAVPALPVWNATPFEQRRDFARRQIAEWRSAHEGPVRVRVALPEGPGSTLLFALIAADWLRIGVEAERVGFDADADARLIDAVAPAASAIWYFQQIACPIADDCDLAVTEALGAVAEARALDIRASHLARADVALTEAVRFVPIARPLRWSLVAPRLEAWQTSPRAFHPLHHLREEPN